MGMIEIDSLSLSAKRIFRCISKYKKEFEYNNPDFDLDMYLQKGEKYFHSYKLKEEKKIIK